MTKWTKDDDRVFSRLFAEIGGIRGIDARLGIDMVNVLSLQDCIDRRKGVDTTVAGFLIDLCEDFFGGLRGSRSAEAERAIQLIFRLRRDGLISMTDTVAELKRSIAAEKKRVAPTRPSQRK